MTRINASIVLYHNKKHQVLKAVNSILNTKFEIKLYLLDNSLNDDLRDLANLDKRIEYIFNNSNLGFGKAHNIAIKKSIEDGVKYHLVLNPDIYFENDVFEKLCKYMIANPDVGLVMPRVLHPDGRIQYLCKLLPTPFDLFGRRFLNFYPIKKYLERRNEMYELKFTEYNKIMAVPYLSGCFMFLKVKILEDVGIFDETFFMYLEDVDLSRRIYNKYKNIYYPKASIYHEWGKGSYKNKTMLIYHISSAIKYFNKWGWIDDEERDQINEATLKELGF
jgi:GT2 family glycosyltransferase